MAGGRLRILVPGLSNADAIAHAIVASAKVYGADPIKALAPQVAGPLSPHADARCLPAAISALATWHGDLPPLCRLLNRNLASVRQSGKVRRPNFVAAVAAARTSIAAAGGQLEARMAAPAALVVVEPVASPAMELPKPSTPIPRERASAVGPIHRPTPILTDPLPGPLSSRMRPQLTGPNPVSPPPGTLKGQILDALQDGSFTSSGMASWLGIKETLVTQSLSLLRHERLVVSDPPEGNTRGHRWSLAAKTKAAAE